MTTNQLTLGVAYPMPEVCYFTAIKNVLSGSKKLSSTLKFARKLSPGHQRVAVHRNSTQKHAQGVEKPPRDLIKLMPKCMEISEIRLIKLVIDRRIDRELNDTS